MTPDRLREILQNVGWSQRQLADELGVDPRRARRWCTGEIGIPAALEKWMEAINSRPTVQELYDAPATRPAE